MDDNVTVNGDADTDTTVLHDTNNAGDIDYTIAGATFDASHMAAATINTENASVLGGPGQNEFIFNNVPLAAYTVAGNGNTLDILTINGVANQTMTYTPSATTNGSGSVAYQGRTIAFGTIERVRATGLDSAKLVTPNAIDVLSIVTDRVAGTSGGVAFSSMEVDNIGACLIDLETNEGPNVADDVDFIGASAQSTLYRVATGGGSNTIDVTATNDIDTQFGLSGGQTNTITVFGATARFHNLQTPKSLILRDDGVATFIGSGALLTTPDLQVPSSRGTINLPSGTSGSVGSTFKIAGAATLTKNGGGILTIGAAVVQSHTGGSLLNVDGGTMSLFSDAGSAAARRLNAGSRGGTLVFETTQHLRSIFAANGGTVRMSHNRNRVLVTESIGVDNDVGGKIDLTDNNLIVDYTGNSVFNDVETLLEDGYAGGVWNGNGLVSSTAAADATTGLGYAERTSVLSTFPTIFAGETIDSTAILVRHTLNGDTNLNRTVDFQDLVPLAQNYNPVVGNKTWVQGNFNYNTGDSAAGAVGFPDLVALAQNYNLSILSASPISRNPMLTRRDPRLLGSQAGS
jgi:hypothetical protein